MPEQQAMKPKPHNGCRDHQILPARISLRRLQAGDSLEHLTGMLHRAFSRIGEMGISCSCVDQTAAVTRQRIERGDRFVAVSGQQIVGTITLYAPDAASDSRHYRDERMASVRQFAVDPLIQGQGVGAAMLVLAERWARRHGYTWLALDTPELASHLIDYYQHQGFRIVEALQFSGRPYRSVLFTKPLYSRPAITCRTACPASRRRSTSPAHDIHWQMVGRHWGSVVAQACRARLSPGAAIKVNLARRRL